MKKHLLVTLVAAITGATAACGPRDVDSAVDVVAVDGFIDGASEAEAQALEASNRRFKDVAPSHWAFAFIEGLRVLVRNGEPAPVVSGYPAADGTFSFKPDRSLTRAEFASMLGRAFAFPAATNASTNFPDVTPQAAPAHWAATTIGVVVSAGWMRGYPDGTFRPDRQITRQEVLVTLANGLSLTAQQQGFAGSCNEDMQTRYDDSRDIAGWACKSIAAATFNNLVVNPSNRRLLRPTASATRAEVAAVLYQALTLGDVAKPLSSSAIVAFSWDAETLRRTSGLADAYVSSPIDTNEPGGFDYKLSSNEFEIPNTLEVFGGRTHLVLEPPASDAKYFSVGWHDSDTLLAIAGPRAGTFAFGGDYYLIDVVGPDAGVMKLELSAAALKPALLGSQHFRSLTGVAPNENITVQIVRIRKEEIDDDIFGAALFTVYDLAVTSGDASSTVYPIYTKNLMLEGGNVSSGFSGYFWRAAN